MSLRERLCRQVSGAFERAISENYLGAVASAQTNIRGRKSVVAKTSRMIRNYCGKYAGENSFRKIIPIITDINERRDRDEMQVVKVQTVYGTRQFV